MKNQEDHKVWWLRTPALWRHNRNCGTQNRPGKLGDFWERGPWNFCPSIFYLCISFSCCMFSCLSLVLKVLVVYTWFLYVVLLIAFCCCSSFVLLYHNLQNCIFSPACYNFWEFMGFICYWFTSFLSITILQSHCLYPLSCIHLVASA